MPSPKHVDVPDEATEAFKQAVHVCGHHWDGWIETGLQAAAPIIASKAVEEVKQERDSLQRRLDGRKLLQRLDSASGERLPDELPDALAAVEGRVAEVERERDQAVEEERERLGVARDALATVCKLYETACADNDESGETDAENWAMAFGCFQRAERVARNALAALDQNGDDDV